MGAPISSYSFTFTVDQGLLALALMGVEALVGIVGVVYGMLLIQSRISKRMWLSPERLARELAGWADAHTALTAAQADHLWRQFRTLTGWGVLGAALGWLAAIAAICAIALGATGTLASLVASGGSALQVIMFQGVALGMTLGFLVGSARATQRPAPRAYADLRRRRASDYRAGWLAWGPAVVGALALAPLTLLATRAPHITLTLCGASWTLATPAVVAGFVALGALIPTLAALCVLWIAQSPRTLLAAEPETARGADDYRRALGVASIVGFAWMSSGSLLQALGDLITTNLRDGQATMLASACLLIGLAVYICGLCLLPLRGRLGGRVTGWRAAMRPVAPSAGGLASE